MTGSLPSSATNADTLEARRAKAAALNRSLVPFLPLSAACLERRGEPLKAAKKGAEPASWEEVAATLPAEVFEPSTEMAAKQLGLTLAFMAVSWTVLGLLPWYLLPVGWALAGFAASGLFVIGRDCANYTWLPSHAACDIVQVLARVPTMTTVHGSGDTTAALGLVFGAGVYALAGWGGLFKLWILPLLFFLVWTTMFQNLADAAPEEAIAAHGVLHAVRSNLPAPLAALVAHVNYNLRPTARGRVPSYRLEAAVQALERRFADNLTVVAFNLQTLLELGTRHLTVTGDTEAPPAPTYAQFIARLYWLHIVILSLVPALGFYGSSH